MSNQLPHDDADFDALLVGFFNAVYQAATDNGIAGATGETEPHSIDLIAVKEAEALQQYYQQKLAGLQATNDQLAQALFRCVQTIEDGIGGTVSASQALALLRQHNLIPPPEPKGAEQEKG